MADNEKFTARQLIDAIRDSRGIKSAIARRLGCHRHTVDNYINRYATVRRAYEEEREAIVDMAEAVLLRKLQADDWPAARYTLSTLGRARGFFERREIGGVEGGAPFTVIIEREDTSRNDAEAD